MATVSTYFSGKDDLQAVVLGHLDHARNLVQVAVAWFTDTRLFDRLMELQRNGVRVELIITRHDINLQSRNDHEAIAEQGGLFLEVGSDDQLMHHKFCIIDRKVLLQGSYNWTFRANQSNNETLTVIEDDPDTVNRFVEEFDRLKRVAGVEEVRKELELAKVFEYFKLLRAFIGLGRTSEVNAYAHDLKGMEGLDTIADLLLAGDFGTATSAMSAFEQQHSRLVDVSAAERAYLLGRIQLLNGLVSQLVGERSDLLAIVERFNHRFRTELNPLIAKILELKKKIYDKLRKYGVEDRTYEEIDEEFKRVNEEYEAESSVHVAELTEDEEQDIRKMYHEAATLCHPDSAHCVFADQKEAAEVFSELSRAKKANDIATVREILAQLRAGSWKGVNAADALDALRAQLAAMEHRYASVLREVEAIRTSEPYLTIEKLDDWDTYFQAERVELETRYDELQHEYVNNDE